MGYQMNTMSREEQNAKLGGIIALCKVQVSKAAEFCAREALQVFGGAGYTRTGKGEKVERIYREVRAYAIPGGSEEIMLNLAISQMKFVSKTSPDPKDAVIKKLQSEVAKLRSAQGQSVQAQAVQAKCKLGMRVLEDNMEQVRNS